MKQIIKNLIKSTWIYKYWLRKKEEKYRPILEEKSKNFHKEGSIILNLFSKALNDEKLDFWIEFGTLLGYFREHDFISHDCDLDTGAWLRDAPAIKKTLEHAGFTRIRHYYVPSDGGLEECYKHKDYETTIDVFYFREDESYMYCYLFNSKVDFSNGKNLNVEVPFSVKRVNFPKCGLVNSEFKNAKVKTPDDIDIHLRSQYGDDYMIPNPHFNNGDRKNVINYTYKEKPAFGVLIRGYGL